MSFDRKYLVCALVYASAGMTLGIIMAASHNHGQHVTHAHVLLVGFVASLIYGVIHRLWLTGATPRLARVQFGLHHAGAVTMFVGLGLLYGGVMPQSQLDPVLAAASLAVLTGMVLMLVMVLKDTARAGAVTGAGIAGSPAAAAQQN